MQSGFDSSSANVEPGAATFFEDGNELDLHKSNLPSRTIAELTLEALRASTPAAEHPVDGSEVDATRDENKKVGAGVMDTLDKIDSTGQREMLPEEYAGLVNQYTLNLRESFLRQNDLVRSRR